MNNSVKVVVCKAEDLYKIRNYVKPYKQNDITAILGSMADGVNKEEEFINSNEEYVYPKILFPYNVTYIPKINNSMNLAVRPVIESRQLVDFLTYSLYDGSYPLENYDLYLDKDIVAFGYYPTQIIDEFYTVLGVKITNKIDLNKSWHWLYTDKSFTFNYSNNPQEPLKLETFTEYNYSFEKESDEIRFIKCKTHLYPFNKLFKNKINHNEKFYKDKEDVLVKVTPIYWYIDRINGRLICLTPLICGVDTFCYDSNDENHVLNKYLNEVFFKDLTQELDLDKILNTVYDKEKRDAQIDLLPKYRVLQEEDYKLIREIGINKFIEIERENHKKIQYINNPFGLRKEKENIKTYIDLDVPLIVLPSLISSSLSDVIRDKYYFNNVYDVNKLVSTSQLDLVTSSLSIDIGSEYFNKIKVFIEKCCKEKPNEICVFTIDITSIETKRLMELYTNYQKPSNARIILYSDKNMLYQTKEINFLDNYIVFEYNEYDLDDYDLLKFAIYQGVHPLLCALICVVGEGLCKKMIKNKCEWLTMSRTLYNTNNIFLLKDSLGNSMYKILCDLYLNKNFISLEDVINRNYNSDELRIEKADYIQIAYLSTVDNNNIEVVRNFVIQMYPELLNFFDSLWSRNDNGRKIILEELSKTNNMVLKQ